MKFKTHYNQDEFPKLLSVNEEPSEMVPGMSLTIAEIMRKFASGISPQITQAVHYDGLDNFDAVDPTLDPAFDYADASLLSQEIEARQEARRAQAKKRSEAKADEPLPAKAAEGASISSSLATAVEK